MGAKIARLWLIAVFAGASVAVSAALDRGDTANACGSAGPFDFDTYEVEDYINGYGRAIELAAAGKAITSATTLANGEIVDVRYQGLKSGPRTARLPENMTFRVPPSIYKSIAWIETGAWQNAIGSVPWGGVGPTLRADDCGYGLGQITSGMSNATGSASARQSAIGTHYLYNLAEGVRILADKWNSAPRFRPIAGTGNPAALEDWYYAIWSYNGFAFSNHPMNPDRDPLRGGTVLPIFHCNDETAPSYQAAGGLPKFGYGDYTYQERVYGCMRHPPIVDPPGPAEAKRLFPAQTFLMPDTTEPTIGKPLEVKNFIDCESAGFNTGCPAMDLPTTVPGTGIIPHLDTTPLVDPSLAPGMLGAPRIAVSGPATASVDLKGGRLPAPIAVTVTNTGTSIGSYRARSTAAWLVAKHPGDPAGRYLDAGVVIGSEMDVVTQSPTSSRPRIAQKGYTSNLQVTVIPSLVPQGKSQATFYVEPVLGSGAAYALTVVVENIGNTALPNIAVAPGVTANDRR